MKKAFVGISGGVDSSVTAALLKQEGFDVTGVFIQVWQPPFLECTTGDDRRDAMRVCARLGIPFLLCDARDAYKREVVDYMKREYLRGRTPNPDVMCNKSVKFGVFFDFAMANGADFIATGHYAKVVNGNLYQAKDKEKDQSYFLSQVSRDKLKKTVFPLGDLYKSEVRILASKFELHTADKKDSQGLCFLGKLNMKDFLREILESEGEVFAKGKVLNHAGVEIGDHQGAIFYTIGERHGFSIYPQFHSKDPLYVVSKDIINNTITVGQKLENTKLASQVVLSDLNWLSKDKIAETEQSFVYRYHGKEIPAVVSNIREDKVKIRLNVPIGDIALGQIGVLFDGNKCILSGIIDELIT